MKKLVFATGNKGKAKEAAEILGEGFEVVIPSDLGIFEEAAETGSSFRENSELKARFIYDLLLQRGRKEFDAVFADDSGLEVDALNGEPGLFTARYAGGDRNFADNMDKLLFKLKEAGAIKGEDRKARFRCAVTAIGPNGSAHYSDGLLEGSIALEKSGSGGFGYDPVFIPSGAELQNLAEQGISPEDLDACKGKTLADIPESWKNLISHRYKALKGLWDKPNGKDI